MISTVSKYVRRSPYQALSAVSIMSLTFFAISVFAMLTILSIRFFAFIETSPQLSIFFKDSATSAQIKTLSQKLEGTGKTASVTYVSKEDALKIYRNDNKNEDPIISDLVVADILPRSIDVRATQAKDLIDLANYVKNSPIIERMVFQKDIIESFTSVMSAVRTIGVSIISILVVVSTLVIITIIGIKITVRREEIETMRLLGASNWFIRAPFLLEGAIYGLIGALVGGLTTVGLFYYFSPNLEHFFAGFPILPLSPLLIIELLLIEIISACALGIFASYLAVLRYLK